MGDEILWQADRAKLRQLRQTYPEWTRQQLATALKRSLAWVKKWLARFRLAAQDDTSVLFSRPHLRLQPLPPTDPLITERILALRDDPPDNLNRVPGPKTLAYFLKKDPVLKAKNLKAPTSTATIWKILKRNGRIHRPREGQHRPLPRPAPLQEWQLDFKDCSTVQVDPDGKHAHVVEVLNVVDVGTSILVEAVARTDFNAETALTSIAAILKDHGLPCGVTFDRDPRWVGSSGSRDFPSAFIKFWHCLGVKVNLCPPHRPDLNGFVERYHRSYGSECLAVHRPDSLAKVREVTAQYKQHYNYERPHQGVSCNNQPPRLAFPELPLLPALPLFVDPDRWLQAEKGKRFIRKVLHNGTIKLDKHHYYVSQELAGQFVQLELGCAEKELRVIHKGQVQKRLALKGLYRQELAFEDYLAILEREARSERRLAVLQAIARRRG